MKRAIAVLSAALLVLAAASCKSSSAAINSQFRDTYERYKSALILDGAESYTVTAGDTLTRIARNKYGRGNAYHFPVILLASNIILDDPDMIEIGTVLTIPDLQRNLSDTNARAQIKLFLADVANIYRDTDKRWSQELYENLLNTSHAL